MAEMLKLDWSSAEVSDAKLKISLSSAAPKKWRDAFERTAALLSHGKWETVLSPRKGSVVVSPVQAGDEDRVRQFLEGVVLEANTTLVTEQELFEDLARSGDEDDESQEQGGERDRDQELTDSFRSFAHSAR
jgi:hypothetical protein